MPEVEPTKVPDLIALSVDEVGDLVAALEVLRDNDVDQWATDPESLALLAKLQTWLEQHA